MNTPNCFKSFTRKYLFLSPRTYFTRCIYRKHLKNPATCLDLPLLIGPSVVAGFHHPTIASFKHYSSEPSTAEKCSSEPSTAEKCSPVHPTINILPIKFEEMSFEDPVPHEELMATLQKCKNLPEQMETLASTVALPSKDIENRKKFCKTLELLFKPFFTNVKIQMFGSSVNYFGFKGCDIDMTFETSVGPIEKIPYIERPDVPLVSEVISGKVSVEEISRLPYREQLLFMHTVLLEYYKESSDPSIFINAHVPLVRFYHDKFNLKCDLTFKNDVAFANTKLLYFYAKLDERVIPLIMTIRYWAKHVELIGKGLMFNTYTITLLVIHFLQTRKPPVLPSAQSILSLSDSFKTDDMDDNSFLNLIQNIPPTKNSQPVDELLREFFFYYLYFDFSRVIVPLIGSSIPRKEFIPIKEPKFILNTLSIQDPLCTSHNVADLVEFKCARKLYTECSTICKMYQDNEMNILNVLDPLSTFNNTASLLEFSIFMKFYSELAVISKMFQDNDALTPSTDPWGLMAILHKPERYDFRSLDILKPISFIFPVKSKSSDDRICLQSEALLTAKTVLKVLEHALLFECSYLKGDKIVGILERHDKFMADKKKELLASKHLQQEFPLLRKKRSNSKKLTDFEIESLSAETTVEQFKKVSDEHELILCCMCKISKDVCKGRELIKLNLPNVASDALNQEHLISNAVTEQNIANEKKKSYNYLFECYFSSNASQSSILVILRPLYEKTFSNYGYKTQCIRLGIFLKDYIPKIMKKLEL